MNVSLTPELDAFVEQAVRSGRYGSASEAVREGLRMLQEREAKFERLKQDIKDGIDSGPAVEKSFAEIAKAARAKWEGERQPSGKRHAAE